MYLAYNHVGADTWGGGGGGSWESGPDIFPTGGGGGGGSWESGPDIFPTGVSNL